MLGKSLVVLGANVITLDSRRPRAQAIAVQNGRIVAVGSNSEMRKHIKQASVVLSLKGKTVVPGFVDCHVHMMEFGQELEDVRLRHVKSIREMQATLRFYAANNPRKKWIVGGRWDEEKFAEKRFPTKQELDAAIPDRPVFIKRICGHIAVANSKALEVTGFTEQTEIIGGLLGRDRTTGILNGVLFENALDRVQEVIPKPTLEQLEEKCILACRRAVKAGLTGVHWILSSMQEAEILQKLQAEERLPLRVYLGIPVALLDSLAALNIRTGFGNEMLKIGFIKILADGSLGGRTAALKEPYSDDATTCGLMLYDQDDLKELVRKAHAAGLQLAIHAIGDKAIDEVITAYEDLGYTHQQESLRHRIEHCSLLSRKLISRMEDLRLIASVQPHFVASDVWINKRLGKRRARWAYPFKSLINKKVIVVSGSDCPIEDISPILGIWAAVHRRNSPQERLTVEEALRTYTINAAYASHSEKEKGALEIGKLADFTVLSDDPFATSSAEMKRIIVEMTVVNGNVVYSKTPFQE